MEHSRLGPMMFRFECSFVGYFPVVLFLKYRRGDHKHLAQWLAVCSASTVVSHSGLMIRDNSTTKAINGWCEFSGVNKFYCSVFATSPTHCIQCIPNIFSQVANCIMFFWMEKTTLKHQPRLILGALQQIHVYICTHSRNTSHLQPTITETEQKRYLPSN